MYQYNSIKELHIPIEINNSDYGVTSYCEDARQYLITFYINHPEIEFIDAEISSDICGYDWEVLMETKFKCTIVGDTEPIEITANWDQAGCSCNEFCGFEKSDPYYSIDCVYENRKWYRVPTSIRNKITQDNKTILEIGNNYNILEKEHRKKLKELAEERNKYCTIL